MLLMRLCVIENLLANDNLEPINSQSAMSVAHCSVVRHCNEIKIREETARREVLPKAIRDDDKAKDLKISSRSEFGL